MTDFKHSPHPRLKERPPVPPLTVDEHVGFNGRLGAAITRGVGTMWAFYIATAFMGLWMILGNIVQLLLMFVILVGQQVLGASSDKRAVQTYQDAEAILHECLELQRHLTTQDQSLDSLITRMESVAGGPQSAR